MATGLLVVGVGQGTRLLQFVADAPKQYIATCRLGATTNTDDAEGEITETADASALTELQIRQAFAAQVGQISQRPPAFSAIKVGGVRSYHRARAGEDFELASRPVQIDAISVTDIRREQDFVDVDFTVDCGKGTYIRAIARDAGIALGVGGHLTALRRTRNAGFSESDACEIEQALANVIDLCAAAAHCMPTVELDGDQVEQVHYGRQFDWPWQELAGPVALCAQGRLLAVAQAEAGRCSYHAVFEVAG